MSEYQIPPHFGHHTVVAAAGVQRCLSCAAIVQEAPCLKNMRARGRIIFLFFPRAARARALKIRQINSAILKVPDAPRMELLDTDSCRGTVPMEPPMSNSSMGHQNPDLDFDDTRMILYGASCTIAARAREGTDPAACVPLSWMVGSPRVFLT